MSAHTVFEHIKEEEEEEEGGELWDLTLPRQVETAIRLHHGQADKQITGEVKANGLG